MSKQILMCVETNKQSDTDTVYISCTLSHYYEESRKISRKTVHLGSKTKYCDRAIQKEIAKFQKGFPGETAVIYFIDTDEYTVKPEDKKLLEDIKDYCSRQEYDLVLFTKDIEDVFWGNQCADTEKIKKATQFRMKNMIDSISEASLSSKIITRHQSNILSVLDKYLPRKVK